MQFNYECVKTLTPDTCHLQPSPLGRMPQINVLRGANAAAELDFVTNFLQHDFESPKHGHEVKKIVIPQMSDTKHVALHRALSIGKDGAESRAHFLDDLRGLDPRRGVDGGHGVRR